MYTLKLERSNVKDPGPCMSQSSQSTWGDRWDDLTFWETRPSPLQRSDPSTMCFLGSSISMSF